MHLFVLTKRDIVSIVDVFCSPQEGSTLNATHCTFTSNSAEDNGGAIVVGVRHHMQGLTIVENRINHNNDNVLYHKFLEWFPFLY